MWDGEIYLELHRATLTSQSGVKRKHRRAERALITAETIASLAHMLGAGRQPRSLESDWRVVLKNEFHDILPGSSIREVYQDAEQELDGVIEHAKAEQAGDCKRCRPSCRRAGLAMPSSSSIRPSRRGRSAQRSPTARSSRPRISSRPCPSRFSTRACPPAGGLKAGHDHLENDHLSVAIGKDGAVVSLIHKASGREAVDGSANQLWVYPADKPRNWDAWDIDADYAERPSASMRLTVSPSLKKGRTARRSASFTVTGIRASRRPMC